jgi:hypothetical protein
MWHAWENREICTPFWWEIPKERDYSEDRGVDGLRMDLFGRLAGGWVEWIKLAENRDGGGLL